MIVSSQRLMFQARLSKTTWSIRGKIEAQRLGHELDARKPPFSPNHHGDPSNLRLIFREFIGPLDGRIFVQCHQVRLLNVRKYILIGGNANPSDPIDNRARHVDRKAQVFQGSKCREWSLTIDMTLRMDLGNGRLHVR